MDDAAVTVSTFTREMEMAAVGPGELDTLFDQPVNAVTGLGDGPAHCVLVAQVSPGRECVRCVRLFAVTVVEHGGNAALGPLRGTAVEPGLAEYGDPEIRRQGQGGTQAGGAAADDQDIVLVECMHEGY